MSTFIHAMNFELEVCRCYDCGRVHAHESSRMWQYKGSNTCPCCASRIQAAHFKRIEELERTVAALKGALTKAKRK